MSQVLTRFLMVLILSTLLLDLAWGQAGTILRRIEGPDDSLLQLALYPRKHGRGPSAHLFMSTYLPKGSGEIWCDATTWRRFVKLYRTALGKWSGLKVGGEVYLGKLASAKTYEHDGTLHLWLQRTKGGDTFLYVQMKGKYSSAGMWLNRVQAGLLDGVLDQTTQGLTAR